MLVPNMLSDKEAIKRRQDLHRIKTKTSYFEVAEVGTAHIQVLVVAVVAEVADVVVAVAA